MKAIDLLRVVQENSKITAHVPGEIGIPKYANDKTPDNHVGGKRTREVDGRKGLGDRKVAKPTADVGTPKNHERRSLEGPGMKPKKMMEDSSALEYARRSNPEAFNAYQSFMTSLKQYAEKYGKTPEQMLQTPSIKQEYEQIVRPIRNLMIRSRQGAPVQDEEMHEDEGGSMNPLKQMLFRMMEKATTPKFARGLVDKLEKDEPELAQRFYKVFGQVLKQTGGKSLLSDAAALQALQNNPEAVKLAIDLRSWAQNYLRAMPEWEGYQQKMMQKHGMGESANFIGGPDEGIGKVSVEKRKADSATVRSSQPDGDKPTANVGTPEKNTEFAQARQVAVKKLKEASKRMEDLIGRPLQIDEKKWIKTDPKKKGMFKGKSAGDIDSELSHIKDRNEKKREKGEKASAADKKKEHELEFAKRAKKGHGFKESEQIEEKWDSEAKVKKMDKFGKAEQSLESLRKQAAALRKKETRTAAESKKLKELNFAIRSRSGWGKATEGVGNPKLAYGGTKKVSTGIGAQKKVKKGLGEARISPALLQVQNHPNLNVYWKTGGITSAQHFEGVMHELRELGSFYQSQGERNYVQSIVDLTHRLQQEYGDQFQLHHVQESNYPDDFRGEPGREVSPRDERDAQQEIQYLIGLALDKIGPSYHGEVDVNNDDLIRDLTGFVMKHLDHRFDFVDREEIRQAVISSFTPMKEGKGRLMDEDEVLARGREEMAKMKNSKGNHWPRTKAQWAGAQARHTNQGRETNPHAPEHDLHSHWNQGWDISDRNHNAKGKFLRGKE